MSIYKPKYLYNGEKKTSRKWYIKFSDHNRVVRRIPASTNKALTQRLERVILEIVEHRRMNMPFSSEINSWLMRLDRALVSRLRDFGVLSEGVVAETKAIERYVDAYLKHLEGLGRSQSHIDNTEIRINKFVRLAGIAYANEITKDKFIFFRDKHLRNHSPTTRNHYLATCKAFCQWLSDSDALHYNPLLNVQRNRQSPQARGVLTRRQFTELIISVRKEGVARFALPAVQRAMLYTLAGNTGLRKSELLSLKWGMFDFERKSIYLPAELTKSRREALMPLNSGLVKQLQIYQKEIGAESLFPSVKNKYYAASKALREDLTSAGLPTKDQAGNKIVFHSFRNSFITFLANENVPVKIIQELARHSNPALTMNIYARAYSDKLNAAVDNLPC